MACGSAQMPNQIGWQCRQPAGNQGDRATARKVILKCLLSTTFLLAKKPAIDHGLLVVRRFQAATGVTS
jgi:hypothetical protein